MHLDTRLDAIDAFNILRVRETEELVPGAGTNVEDRAAGLCEAGGEGGGCIGCKFGGAKVDPEGGESAIAVGFEVGEGKGRGGEGGVEVDCLAVDVLVVHEELSLGRRGGTNILGLQRSEYRGESSLVCGQRQMAPWST